MATNEITNGCGLSTEAVLPLNRKRRRVETYFDPIPPLGPILGKARRMGISAFADPIEQSPRRTGANRGASAGGYLSGSRPGFLIRRSSLELSSRELQYALPFLS